MYGASSVAIRLHRAHRHDARDARAAAQPGDGGGGPGVRAAAAVAVFGSKWDVSLTKTIFFISFMLKHKNLVKHYFWYDSSVLIQDIQYAFCI